MLVRAMPNNKVIIYAVIIFLLIIPMMFGKFYTGFTTRLLIMAILAMSLDLVWGYTGVISIGHAAFFGIGAYVTALCLTKFGEIGIIWGFLISIVVVSVLCYILGEICFKANLAGLYFAFLTLALSSAFQLVATSWTNITGGLNGIKDYPTYSQIYSVNNEKYLAYYTVLVIAILSYVLCKLIVNSYFGKVLVAIRENENRSYAIGFNNAKFKTIILVFSGILASVAGVLYAPYNGIVAPSILSFNLSTEAIIWVAIGGKGTIIGPAIGSFFLNILKLLLSGVWIQFWLIIMAVVFICVVMFLPKGLISIKIPSFKKSNAKYERINDPQ